MNIAVVAAPLPDAPYRGIQPFRFIDQQIFAAREDETWTLLSNVTLYRAVLLYGDSGTGKSSLVNAGLLPKALKENYVPDRLRVQPFAGREIKVERIRMSGAEEQATYLPSNFAPTESDDSAETLELSLADFRARLEQFRPATDHEAAAGVFRAPRTTPRPLLIFDQFEEFITLFEEAQRVGTTEETRLALEQVPAAQRDILALLVELIQDETLPIKILFAFREDYLAKLSILFDHCPELLDQAQRLLPPSIEDLPRIIRAPFADPALRAHFLEHSGTDSSEISEAMAQKLAAALGRRSEGDTANLTELQIVCQRLWQARHPEELFAKDGIEGLLKDYGTDVFRNFTPEQRDTAVVLLSHMITASNTRNIISEEDLLNRTAECNFEPSQCSAALSALSRSQIVRREPRHSIYFYEITSEYLVPWIKERVTERKAIESHRQAEEERFQALILESKQRRTRMLKRAVAILIVLLISALTFAWYAYRQYKRAGEAETQATLAHQQTKEILNSLVRASTPNEDQKQGIAELEKLIDDKKIPPDLASVVIQSSFKSDDTRVLEAGRELVEQTAKTNPNVAQSLESYEKQQVAVRSIELESRPIQVVVPTPEHKSSNGSLVLKLIDAEDGKSLPGVNPSLTLRHLSKSKDEIGARGTELSLEPGSYDVFVAVKGYVPSYRLFSIRAGAPTSVTLKLNRRTPKQEQVPLEQAPVRPYQVPARPYQAPTPGEQLKRQGYP